MDIIKKNITIDDSLDKSKYLLLNKIINFNKDKNLDGGFQNNFYYNKYIKYKTKYNNLKIKSI